MPNYFRDQIDPDLLGDIAKLTEHLGGQRDVPPDIAEAASRVSGSRLAALLTAGDRLNIGASRIGNVADLTRPIIPPIVFDPVPVAPAVNSVQEAINNVPIVVEGDAITPEHHNSLRTAIKALAASAGQSIDQLPVLRIEPRLAGDGDAVWRFVRPGVAWANSKPASGFAPITLPDGARLTKVRVKGTAVGMTVRVVVHCYPRPVSFNQNVTLGLASITPTSSEFTLEAVLRTPRLPFDRGGRVDLTVVDNEERCYSVGVECEVVPEASEISTIVESIEVEYQPA